MAMTRNDTLGSFLAAACNESKEKKRKENQCCCLHVADSLVILAAAAREAHTVGSTLIRERAVRKGAEVGKGTSAVEKGWEASARRAIQVASDTSENT